MRNRLQQPLKHSAAGKWICNNGQSLLEVIVAVAVGAIAILASVTVLTLILRISSQDVSFQTAAFLGQELMDNVAVTVERDWQEIAAAPVGQNLRLATTSIAGIFAVESGVSEQLVDGVAYSTFFRVSPVNRDSGGRITESGGVADPSTKRVNVFTTWLFRGDPATSTISRYVTRSKNRVFHQTDWSGGPTDPTDEVVSQTYKFLKASSSIDFSQPGEIKIKL